MPNVKGCFVFRDEGDGCLTSKYLEHSETEPYTESCKTDPKRKSVVPFVGIYKTSWLESGNGDFTAQLTIDKIMGTDAYDLKWRTLSKQSPIEYDGRAMIFENKLIGCYWRVI
jgi:hypothetical protein